MKLFRITFLCILFVLSMKAASLSFTNEMKYETNYQEALKKSQETKKPIFMMISTQTCPWCRKLEAQTLRKVYINEYIQKNYIPLSVTRDKDKYPDKFKAPAVPTIYFVDSNEQKLGRIIGYKPHYKFIEKLKDINYTIKPIVKTSPYSLENLKEFHVKFFDKSKLLTKEQKEQVKQKLTKHLQKFGFNTTPKDYSNFVIKIESVELGKAKALNITLRVIENVIPKRDTKLQSLGITYYKNDLFELEEEPLEAIEESIFSFLVPEFIKQYKEENK